MDSSCKFGVATSKNTNGDASDMMSLKLSTCSSMLAQKRTTWLIKCYFSKSYTFSCIFENEICKPSGSKTLCKPYGKNRTKETEQ